jgi:peptidoglycan/xylan/chitin deacetylase (PgdA/CDA1 family)
VPLASYGQVRQRQLSRRSPTLDCRAIQRMYSCNQNRKYKVHLTFDDGPHPKNTPQILDALKKHKIPATFFVLGEKLETNRSDMRAIVHRISEEGHTIGSHSFSHLKHTEIPRQQAARLISSSITTIEEKVGQKPYYFRLPHGDGWDRPTRARSAQLEKIVRESKLRHIGWHIDSYDSVPQFLNGQTPIAHLLRSICEMQGGVVLMHDTNDTTAASLDRYIQAVKCAGHSFSGIDDFANDPYFEIRQDKKAILPKHFDPALGQTTRQANYHRHTENCSHSKAQSGWIDSLFSFMKN